MKNILNQNHIVLLFSMIYFLMNHIDSKAQQDPNFTQYFYNTISVNPAYTGTRGHLSMNFTYRSQWLGLDGSPETQNINLHGPVTEKAGIGFSLINDNQGDGTLQNTRFTGSYAYAIPVSQKFKLSLGLSAGGNLYNLDLFKLRRLDQGIPADLESVANRLTLTLGLGTFLYSDRFYLGISTPNVLNPETFSNSNSTLYVVNQKPHLNIISGYVFDISDTVLFKPSVMVRMVDGSPINFDTSANFLFGNAFRLGVAYRYQSAISALAGFNVSPSLLLGVAYDQNAFQLGDVGLANSSLELFLRYEIFNKRKLSTPRFF